jgi:small neutral amino acid transporter SnatA (MarC family)
MARLARMAATLLAFALAYGVFVESASVAAMIGLGELQLLVRLGLTLVALGLADALAGRLLARMTPHP